ncbi:MAG: MASE3 domain-containing protein [Sedimentibacter sp.]
MGIKKIKKLENIREFNMVILIFMFSTLVFAFSAYFNNFFKEIMSVATYLTWHNLFEFASILAAFSIFIVTFYIYDESGSLRMIILGCAFLVMGSIDIFHTLSYKGMEDFFISNISANRATTFWILSRIIGSLGILVAVIIPIQYECKIKKWFFVIPTSIVVMTIFFVVTYLPDFLPAMFIEGQGLTKWKIALEYLVILVMLITFIKIAMDYNKDGSRQEYLFMIGILMSIFSEFAFVSYASVYDIYNYIGHIYKIIAYFILFKAIYAENVIIPYHEMKKTRNDLKVYSENLDFLVKQRTKELENMNEKLIIDIEYAREMQRSLLPTQMPQDISVFFCAGYLPAERLSGDFYNVIKLDESNIAIYIGDVAGHGVSAAMLTIFANQNIIPIKDDEESLKVISPGYVIKSLYKAFNKMDFKDSTYLVMLYGIYNTQNKCFTYASGGINVLPLIIKHTGEIVEMELKGFPICKLGDYYEPFYEDRMIQLESGDKILFYTDGLVEAKNLDGDIYSQEKIKDFVGTNHSLKATELDEAIKENLYKHIGSSGKLLDDVTFLIMEVY